MASVTYGEWLRQQRRHRGISQAQLEQLAPLTHSHLSKIENGHISIPEQATRERIHKVLGTSDEDLVELGLLERIESETVDGRSIVLYLSPDPFARQSRQPPEDSVPPEVFTERLPASLRTSFLRTGDWSEERKQRLIQFIDDLDAADQAERDRAKERTD